MILGASRGLKCCELDYCSLMEDVVSKDTILITGLERIFDLLMEWSKKSLKLHMFLPNRGVKKKKVSAVLTLERERSWVHSLMVLMTLRRPVKVMDWERRGVNCLCGKFIGGRQCEERQEAQPRCPTKAGEALGCPCKALCSFQVGEGLTSGRGVLSEGSVNHTHAWHPGHTVGVDYWGLYLTHLAPQSLETLQGGFSYSHCTGGETEAKMRRTRAEIRAQT